MRTTTKVAATDRANEVERFDDLAPTTTSGQVITHDGTDNVGATIAGTGDVVGPASSTDNALVRFSGTSGKIIDQATIPITHSDGGSLTFSDGQGADWNITGLPSVSASSGIMLLDFSGEATSTIDITPGASGSVRPTRLAPVGTGGSNHVVKQDSAGGTISSGLVVTANITDDSVTYAKIQNVSATDRLLGRDTAAAGDIEELTVTGGVEFTGSGGIQRSALTGDVTASAGSNATTLATKHKTRVVTIRIGAPQTNEKWPLFRVGDAFTLVKVTHKTTAGTCPFNLEYHSTIGTSTGDAWSSNKTADSTQTDDTSFDDATGAADAWVVLSIEADPSTDVGVLDIAVEYTVD